MIQIDMKMPKDCRNCPFTAYIQPEEYHCVITNKNIWFVPQGERDLICPLQEVKEVKAKGFGPNVKMNYERKELDAPCDTCKNTEGCWFYNRLPVIDQTFIEECDGYEKENK